MKSVMKVTLCLIGLAEVGALSAASKQQSFQPGHASDESSEHVAEKPKEDKRPEVVKMEDEVVEHSKRLMTAIEAFRAEVCAHMHEDFGIDFDTFPACKKFMNDACKPGDDQEMDGDHHEVSSGKGYCKEYFPEAKKKAEIKVREEEEAEEKAAHGGASSGPGPAPANSPAPAKEKEEAPAPAPKAAKGDKGGAAPAGAGKGSAPAPGPMGGPAPAPGPVPGPYTPGISGGKPHGPIEDNHAYYYKDGGKHASRLHMDEKLGLPAQGYWGKLVEHEDQETMTDDWQQEFGPKAKHSNVAEICKEHPESAWCHRHFRHRSSGKAVSALLPFAIVLLSMYAF